MAVAISQDTVFHSDDIIEGFAHLKARKVNGKVRWELPGGDWTENYDEALAYAKKLDKIILSNCDRQNRSLLWS